MNSCITSGVSKGFLSCLTGLNHYYRGATVNTRKEWIKPVRQDRKPLDTPEMIHEFIQDVYRKNGIAANRGNSAFITRLQSVAQSYGKTGTAYVVMAVGDFQSSMLDGIGDFYSMLNAIVASILAQKYNIYGVKEFVVKMNTVDEADVQKVFAEIEKYISDHLVNNPDLSRKGSDSEILLKADYIAYFSDWMIEDLAY
jgi:ABC-type transport system substrate-binding protein